MKCCYDVMAVLIGCWGGAIRACLVAWKHGIAQHSQDEASTGRAEKGSEASWVLGSMRQPDTYSQADGPRRILSGL